MISEAIKKPLRVARNSFHNWQTEKYLIKIQNQTSINDINQLDYDLFKKRVLGFIESMRVNNSKVQFCYSASSTQPTLYASAYACMTLSLLGELATYTPEEKQQWIDYFDSFQSPEDGLFYDPVVRNALYDDADWWGARHLALHIISAYTDLGARPKYSFKFLEKYYELNFIEDWLNRFDWSSANIGLCDVDNKLMNIGSLLQYSRDKFSDTRARESVEFIKQYLLKKICPTAGMWGGFDPTDRDQRSRMVQFAYHLFPIFFYDDYFDFDYELIVDPILKTQNRFGGFGVKLNSSACEDIDSIYLLVKFMPYVTEESQCTIQMTLRNAWSWVLLNQVNDGGFVFRLNERMQYGHAQMFSNKNLGAMFPTWFRLLSLAYIYNSTRSNGFIINKAPGLVS